MNLAPLSVVTVVRVRDGWIADSHDTAWDAAKWLIDRGEPDLLRADAPDPRTGDWRDVTDGVLDAVETIKSETEEQRRHDAGTRAMRKV